MENMIVEDQQSQHGDSNASVKLTPEPITPVAQNITPQPNTTPESTPETVNSVAQNPEPTPEPVVKVHSF